MIIPIGLQCTNATFKKEINKTSETLPFDWMFATPAFTYEMLRLLLDEQMDVRELVTKHFFACNKKAQLTCVEKYYVDANGVALYNEKYNVIFPHDTYNDENIEKYIRRFDRLKNIILYSQEQLYFVYTSQSSQDAGNFTIDDNQAVKDVYVNLTKIYDIVGKYNNNYKIIVFDSIQNENVEILHKNIVLYKLAPCSDWTFMVEQMKKYETYFKL